ncbi:MAG TPA: FtsQ-type POTRA domain-containing protein [Gaiellaceae bacterium]
MAAPEYEELPGHSHRICGGEGWEEIASTVLDRAVEHAGARDRSGRGRRAARGVGPGRRAANSLGVVRRPHLAPVPAAALRPELRTPSIRIAAVVMGVIALLGLLYLGARETSVFAAQEIEISGGSKAVRASVRDAVQPVVGESLVSLDQDELRRRLEALPTVRAVRLDRAFPHTLRIAVSPERPLAVLRQGEEEWLVSAQGRVMRTLEPGKSSRPVVDVGDEVAVTTGDVVNADDVRHALAALRRLPHRFPVRVDTARVEEGAVFFALDGGAELRLGGPRQLALKLVVATRVLRALAAYERADLGYLDVTVPERPVAGLKSQVSSLE